MALSAEVRKDAKRYNAEYAMFEAVDQSTGESRLYDGYGVAYRYTAARVARGGNWRIYGLRWVEGRGYDAVELVAC